MASRSPLGAGVSFAILAAVTFGATTPVIAWAGREAGPLSTAALLYAGAAAIAIALRVFARGEASLRRGDLPRLIVIALAGAAIAPTALAWGLARTGATVGALLLNLEAVFTVALAFAIHREPIGRRVALAASAMIAGGALLALSIDGDAGGAATSVLGVAAIAGATLAWALDNTLTRPLADRDPLDVVAAKASLGAACTTIAAIVAGEGRPSTRAIAALLACGATGYGLSLRFYLLAQRRIGAARTGSVFAIAPFVGAAIAFAAGDRALGASALGAAALFALGVTLHATEHHHHRHVHEPLDHDHPHRHDDGHHDHAHDPPFIGEHSHPHHHARVEHDHDHAPDVHHDHH
jgi:drug/metabolite transporter (DMT)-like permease